MRNELGYAIERVRDFNLKEDRFWVEMLTENKIDRKSDWAVIAAVVWLAKDVILALVHGVIGHDFRTQATGMQICIKCWYCESVGQEYQNDHS
jgi:hypothetical protein